jgi:hypothetical protein
VVVYVGTYAIQQNTLSAGTNYTLTYVSKDFSITKAQLTITANSFTKAAGAANPVLTGTIVGIKNGDAITATYSTTATVSSPVGNYPITPTAVDSLPSTLSNYSVKLVNGTLSVVFATGGYLQPVNDTAHGETCGTPCPMSVFKSGSTIPFKFQLKDQNGTVVGPETIMPTFSAVDVGTTVANLDEATTVLTPSTGTSFQYNGGTYQYNWQSPKNQAGHKYLITATIQSTGQKIQVFIVLG